MRNAAVSLFLSEGDANLPEVSIALQTVRAPSGAGLTRPAPGTFERHTEVPSSHPTSVPDIDVEAVAASFTCSLRDTSAVSFSFEHAVPVRQHAPAGLEALAFDVAFLLAHVDGCSTIAQIATHAQVSVTRAIDAFEQMFQLGVVNLASEAVSPPPPSGVYRSAPREEQ